MGKLRIVNETSAYFHDRMEAGRLLAGELETYKSSRPLVLGIPRGGVVIAWEIAKELDGDMDIIFCHKLGAPGNSEFALGAVSENGSIYIDERTRYVADPAYIQKEKENQMKAIRKRAESYRSILLRLPVKQRTVIVTDDGIAMGFTMQAALSSIRAEHPSRIILALPVGPEDTLRQLSRLADETIALCAPSYFQGVSQFFQDFSQVEDHEIIKILRNENLRRQKKDNEHPGTFETLPIPSGSLKK